MITQKQITAFLACKNLAIAGASRDKKKFGNQVMHELMNKGFEIFPVNPHAEEIDSMKVYPDVLSLPETVESLLIVTPKAETKSMLEQALQKGIKHIWIQQMADSPEALEFATQNQMDVIFGKCILMHAGPVKGVHGFHRFFMRLFGKMPR